MAKQYVIELNTSSEQLNKRVPLEYQKHPFYLLN